MSSRLDLRSVATAGTASLKQNCIQAPRTWERNPNYSALTVCFNRVRFLLHLNSLTGKSKVTAISKLKETGEIFKKSFPLLLIVVFSLLQWIPSLSRIIQESFKAKLTFSLSSLFFPVPARLWGLGSWGCAKISPPSLGRSLLLHFFFF